MKADVVGVDLSENMIQLAKSKYPQIPFFVADATKLPHENEFDAVFSNATLHWIKTPDAVLQSIYKFLKPGGRLFVEFGGAGNIQKITDELIQQIHAANILIQMTSSLCTSRQLVSIRLYLNRSASM